MTWWNFSCMMHFKKVEHQLFPKVSWLLHLKLWKRRWLTQLASRFRGIFIEQNDAEKRRYERRKWHPKKGLAVYVKNACLSRCFCWTLTIDLLIRGFVSIVELDIHMLNWPSNEFVLVGVQQGSKTNTCVLVGHRLFWECSKADLLGHILLQSASTSSTCDA